MTQSQNGWRPIADLIALDRRVAMVTGGARGIGFAIARRLAEAGAQVVIGDINEEGAKAAATAIAGSGWSATGMSLDVTDAQSVDDTVRHVVSEYGRLDILVNNAAIFPMMSALDMDQELWASVLRTNLHGPFLCAQAAARQMVQTSTRGVIINVGSVNSIRAASPGLLAYTASKHGLNGLTKSLAIELAPTGIRVLGIAPTLIETPGIQEKRPIFEAAGVDVIAQTAAALPIRRVPDADEIARIALFAASDLSTVMTGSLLLGDGGSMAL